MPPAGFESVGGKESPITSAEVAREAWAGLPTYAANIDSLIVILRAAEELTGVPTKSQEAQLSLTVDASGLHRRRAWAAWCATGSRAGRWGALVQLGATIRAHALDNFAEYRLPRPLEEKIEHNGGLMLTQVVDPEDDEVAQTPPSAPETSKSGPMPRSG